MMVASLDRASSRRRKRGQPCGRLESLLVNAWVDWSTPPPPPPDCLDPILCSGRSGGNASSVNGFCVPLEMLTFRLASTVHHLAPSLQPRGHHASTRRGPGAGNQKLAGLLHYSSLLDGPIAPSPHASVMRHPGAVCHDGYFACVGGPQTSKLVR